MSLTEKEKHFCHLVAAGSSRSAAYREAFQKTHMKPQSVWNAASKLARRPDIQAGIDAAPKQSLQAVLYSAAESFETLCRIQEQALSSDTKPDYGIALKSEELKGKLAGLFVDKKGKKETTDIPRVLVEFVTNDNQDSTDTGSVQTTADDEETD